MKNIAEKRTIYVYIVLSVVFLIVIGVIFNQIGRHYLVNSHEDQLLSEGGYISERIASEGEGVNQIQSELTYFHDHFNVDLFYQHLEDQQLIHTFTDGMNIPQELRSESPYLDEVVLFNQRLVTSFALDDGAYLTVISEPLPLDSLSSTVWWSVFFFSIFVVVLLWSFGSRLYDSYVKPVRKAADTTKALVEGNYKARIHDAPYGIASQLSQSINRLGRYLEYITSKYENQNVRLKTVVNNMESGVLLINERGYTRLVNDAFLQQFSLKANLFIGQIYYEVIDHQELNDVIQEAIFKEKKKQVTIQLEGDRYVEAYLAPINDHDQNWKGVVIVSHEITEIKRLERVRKDFIANVSHELRTPITSIQGFAETILEDNELEDDKREQFLKIIKKESKRLNILVQDLLDLSVIEKEDFVLKKSRFSAAKLMNDVMAIMHESIEEKQLNLSVKVDDDLTIYADYYRLYQLVLNLLSNAIQYTNEQGEISWEIEQENQYVALKVSDTGIGIPKEDQPRIFERFYRVDKGRSRNSGGTGLGLSIVKHIVEAHDGNIEIDSAEGKGTKITVYLPQIDD
ncbi:two-component system histidine kinase PnpS [Alkalibacillus aidingensis]|uniref:two-component system histidine kinase PnpS n=1 Tax=Alkalibacillus aidingensis TaxID=2747607 RepID=UPI00166172D5|nr:ATP-binding protein [Alkalibacillus aidingensis]